MEFTRTQRIVIGAGIGVALLAGAATLGLRGCAGSEVTVVDAAEQQIATAGGQATGYLTVHVTGAVQRPGLYYLRPGARVYDAVRVAGGFGAEANEHAVNLAAFVQDGQQVHIPARPRTAAGGSSMPAFSAPPQAPPPAIPQAAYRAPAPVPSHRHTGGAGAVERPGAHTPAPTPARASEGAAEPTARYGGHAAQPAQPAEWAPPGGESRLNINFATERQLQALPGVGEVLAERIVSHREEHGPFERLEDLLAVRGIGDHTLTGMRPHITLQ